jgi:hypothetical protein
MVRFAGVVVGVGCDGSGRIGEGWVQNCVVCSGRLGAGQVREGAVGIKCYVLRLVSNESLDHQASDSAEQRWHRLVRSSEDRSFGSQRRHHSLLEFHNVCCIRCKSVLSLSFFCAFLEFIHYLVG